MTSTSASVILSAAFGSGSFFKSGVCFASLSTLLSRRLRTTGLVMVFSGSPICSSILARTSWPTGVLQTSPSFESFVIFFMLSLPRPLPIPASIILQIRRKGEGFNAVFSQNKGGPELSVQDRLF